MGEPEVYKTKLLIGDGLVTVQYQRTPKGGYRILYIGMCGKPIDAEDMPFYRKVVRATLRKNRV